MPLRSAPAKKFVFVNLCAGVRVKGVNHGVAFLVPLVKKYGYDVSIINVLEAIPAQEFAQKVLRVGPSILGYSCTSHQFKTLMDFSLALQGHSEILQIAGGVHPTIDPENTLRRTALAGVCVGEGEAPLDELLTRIDSHQDILETQGFFWNEKGTIRKNEIPPFTKDLATLPFPDYSCFDRQFVVRPWDVDRNLVVRRQDEKKYLEVMLSRGCPFDCHFCCNRVLSSVYQEAKKYFRLPSVDHSIALLQELLRTYPETEYIEFIDDLLIADHGWFKQFAAAYRKDIGLPYRTNGRFECINDEIVACLKESGCIRMLFGLESGNEELRRTLLNRHHSNAMIVEKLVLVKKAGIDVCTLNMIGLPTETRAQMHDTLWLNKRVAPQFGVCNFFHPYKGTKLYEVCREQNLLKEEKECLALTNNSEQPFIKLAGMKEAEGRAFQRRMSFYFYTQTCKHRLKQILKEGRGWGKAYAIFALGILFAKGIKLYCRDYIHKKGDISKSGMTV